MTSRDFTRLLLLAVFIVSGPVQADVVYNVFSTAQVNCSPDGDHGLWTNNTVSGGTCPNYFDIQSGSTLTVYNSDANTSNWTAVLDATALNNAGVLATINLTFSNYSDDHTAFDVKNGGGASASQIASWEFFRDIAGTIALTGYSTYIINDLAGNTGLQIGMGANDKTSAFGASAWILGNFPSSHWDINVELEVAAVPEPGMLLLLGLGLLIIGLRIRPAMLA